MSLVKSISVGDGDMFYIKHGSDNFTMIDCCMSDDDRDDLIDEFRGAAKGKGITRFISTHPDQDHIRGLDALDDAMSIRNFYCVKNEATKDEETADFKKYRELRDDSKKAFYLKKGCSRRWMNKNSDERGSAGINIRWPVLTNKHFKAALADAKDGKSPNNISCIVTYQLKDGATMMWMGDLETEFMEKLKGAAELCNADILFAPHHGRESARIPERWLRDVAPKLIIIGEAPAGNLHYYAGYNTITQNSAGDITFDCNAGKTHIYVSKSDYSVDFLDDEKKPDTHGTYLGTLKH